MNMNKGFIENYMGWDIYFKPIGDGERRIIAYMDGDECHGASSNGELVLKLIELPYFKQQLKEQTDELIVLMWEKMNGNE